MVDVILFDLTRIAARLRIETPTGIDRVEFAYARYLEQHYRDRVHFVMHWRGFLRLLPTATVSRYLEVLDHQWGSSQPVDVRRLARRIGRFLGDTQLGDHLDSDVIREQRRDLRRLWRLRLRLTVSSQPLRLPPYSPGQSRVYINVSQVGLEADGGIANWARSEGIDTIFLLHDLIPITHPEYMRKGFTTKHARRVEVMLNQGSSILTNSAFTAHELREYARMHNFAAPPIDVALLSSGFTPSLEEAVIQPAAPYFVIIGTIEPRKNHIFLLQVWRQLAERLGERTPKLLLIGRRGWENENAIDLIERCAAIREHVLECGSVPDFMLQRLIRGAAAVLFPSFAEGYGMPVVEALALGVPVIASDLEVFREIGQNIPEFLNPLDGPSWIRLIEDYADPDSKRRASQLERLRTFSGPTWEEHFQVFERALGRVRSKVKA